MTDNSFKEWASMSDKVLTQYIGAFVRHKRMEQNKTQDELASSAGISRSTLSLLERGETVNIATLIQVLRVLACIIQALYSGQMQGVGSRRHSILFQGFRNAADGLKRMRS